MSNIELLCVGKLKRSFYIEACDFYIKRISPYQKISVRELAECKPRGDGLRDISEALSKEAADIRKHITGDGTLNIALCVEGKALSSEQFAEYIAAGAVRGLSRLRFIIGGSHGLSEDIKRMCGLHLSISGMTFTHAIARVLLLEQLYRAAMINSGGKYHK